LSYSKGKVKNPVLHHAVAMYGEWRWRFTHS